MFTEVKTINKDAKKGILISKLDKPHNCSGKMPQSTMITIGNLICGFEVEEVPSITISGSLAEFKRDRELQDNDLRIIIKGLVLYKID